MLRIFDCDEPLSGFTVLNETGQEIPAGAPVYVSGDANADGTRIVARYLIGGAVHCFVEPIIDLTADTVLEHGESAAVDTEVE